MENNSQCIATTFNILSTNVIANISQKKFEAVASCQQQFINVINNLISIYSYIFFIVQFLNSIFH